jgi:hypothetical protein
MADLFPVRDGWIVYLFSDFPKNLIFYLAIFEENFEEI